jgi:hypothetical protein
MVRPAGRIPFDLVSNDRVRNHGSAGANSKKSSKDIYQHVSHFALSYRLVLPLAERSSTV